MHTSTRLGLEIPDGTDAVDAFPPVSAQEMGVLDNATIFLSGTLASRPAASAEPAGTIYYATDVGLWYMGNGSAWTEIQFIPNLRSATTNVSAAPGDLILANSVTITLPSPSSDARPITIVPAGGGVITGSTPVTINSATGNIYGVGMAAAASFTQGEPLAAIVFVAFGPSWVITSGQIDTGWVPLSLNTGWSAGGSGSWSGYGGPAWRQTGDRACLAGVVVNTSGSSMGAGSILASGLVHSSVIRPVNGVTMTPPSTFTFAPMIVNGVGALETFTSIPNGSAVSLDGISYSL